ncbi:hypothetical protein MLV71_023685 [Escherichia coli]|uniref:hypothetical protein n=1 Tax=Escherichia coli TaxID=562 RepID=UPI001584BE61|nr:hypothetical protein [Escherichia coli]EFM6484035.1 hypothetical protein [Escherichia coli]EHH7725420.1 hypothetical protein [Escherichia coli]EHR8767270.1 hypothetical protein [Escherichia coli]EHY5010029.1 hypothetical protein [Escherichia coli]EIO5991389.1 hypothetical protein [Escherichia coli]
MHDEQAQRRVQGPQAKEPGVIPDSVSVAPVSTDAVQQHVIANDWTAPKRQDYTLKFFFVTMIIIFSYSKWFFCPK